MILTVASAAPALSVHTSSAEENMQEGPYSDQAIAGEYARLKARGTREALELFIERHPHHPLAREARNEIEQCYGRK
ncbi:hypothetical protein [Mycoplana dimorpha]|nr:hypothetical protein [Mycoplana dimorpha]